MARSKRAPGPDPVDRFPLVIETFRELGNYEASSLESAHPSCVNGRVNVVRYRITVERIEEPVEVIHDRILALWNESDNWHDSDPLRTAAKKYGLTLTTDRGSGRKART